MAATKKRIRTVEVKPDRDTKITITLSEVQEGKDGYTWTTYLVQGWQESGKWKRRKFKKLRDADAFVDQLQVTLKNAGGAKHLIQTRMTEEQAREAEDAFHRLGDRYAMREAIDYFLAHYCNPDFKITIKAAKVKFLGAKEKFIRPVSIRQLESTLNQFETFLENVHIHEITPGDVDRYLRSVRAKNGKDPASKKTWNNYRADLSSFFSWCVAEPQKWIGRNPASSVTHFKPRELERKEPEILTIAEVEKLMAYAAEYAGGVMARYFALAVFAGIRPGRQSGRSGEDPVGELVKLARHPDRDKLIDLKRGVIKIPADVAKDKEKREIVIRPNLRAWLENTAAEILPTNHDRLVKHVRTKHGVGHDVLRHCFVSYHISAFRSVGDAAIESGNSEAVIKRHYLNLVGVTEGEAFWKILPAGVAMPKEKGSEKIVRMPDSVQNAG
jgi:integrase